MLIMIVYYVLLGSTFIYTVGGWVLYIFSFWSVENNGDLHWNRPVCGQVMTSLTAKQQWCPFCLGHSYLFCLYSCIHNKNNKITYTINFIMCVITVISHLVLFQLKIQSMYIGKYTGYEKYQFRIQEITNDILE
jgi:hypothetical protein